MWSPTLLVFDPASAALEMAIRESTLTKTEIILRTCEDVTYPIFRCDITGRYFIKRFGMLLEVEYRQGKWEQTGVVVGKKGTVIDE